MKETAPLDPKAMSPDGYIISQRRTSNIKYGWKYSDYNGCGWIAAYNFLHANGADTDYKDVVKSLNRTLLIGGLLGTNVIAEFLYLKKMGFDMHMTFTRQGAVRKASDADSGVVMYFHKRGAHFVAYKKEPDGKMRFINLTDGIDRFMTMSEFMGRYPFFPLVFTGAYTK